MLPSFAKILTDEGYMLVSEISPGDKVYADASNLTVVTKKTLIGEAQVYAYNIGGYTFIGTNDHKVVTVDLWEQQLVTDVEAAYLGKKFVVCASAEYDGAVKFTNKAFIGKYPVYKIETVAGTFITGKLVVAGE